MFRERRRRVCFVATIALGLVVALMIPFIAQGADQFASAAFQQQWNTVEAVIPNFWGPLATARNGQVEQYAEGTVNGQPGVRLVQDFDKARMEQTNADRPVTNGLLTVELKSGQLQVGDVSFQPRNPAFIGIAGDQDVPGPTYASLAQLKEKLPQQSGGVNLAYDVPSQTFITVDASADPAMQFVTYQGDPGGRFGQNVPQAFWSFLQTIPGGWLTTMGYPISPAFATSVRVNNVDNTTVFVQAFERRVLTYTPSNPDAFKVEFGNIGRHYYTWRYETPNSTVTTTPTTTVTVTPSATASTTATPSATASATTTPSATIPATASTTAEATTRGNPPTVPAPTATATTSPAPAPNPRPTGSP
ncbi:MAG: hypothetical protein ACR2M3_20560 [Thermomicrobiales bacterium]